MKILRTTKTGRNKFKNIDDNATFEDIDKLFRECLRLDFKYKLFIVYRDVKNYVTYREREDYYIIEKYIAGVRVFKTIEKRQISAVNIFYKYLGVA